MANNRVGVQVATTTVHVRCEPDYKQWLAAIADAEERTQSQVIRSALKAYAKQKGCEPPPAK